MAGAGRTRNFMLLLAGFLACAGGVGVLLRSQQKAHPSCAMAHHQSVLRSDTHRSLSETERSQLVADKARLERLIAEYEDAMERGEGCRMGFIKYRIELLHIEEQLTRCGYERAQLQRQIAHLEAMRARMLTGYGETQGPAGHDE